MAKQKKSAKSASPKRSVPTYAAARTKRGKKKRRSQRKNDFVWLEGEGSTGSPVSRLRIALVSIFALIALALVVMLVNSIRLGPGDGEVSVILHGAFIAFGFGLVLLLALAASAAAFWNNKPIRIAALAGLTIVVLIPLVGWVQHQITLLRWQKANDRQETRATELVARYDALLDTVPRNLETLIRIRRDFREDQLRLNLNWGSGGSHQWRWKHTLVTRIFADSSYSPADTFSVIDFPSGEACDDFLEQYSDAIDTPNRRVVFKHLCPDTSLD